jgi:DNA-binding MarR family transcriptional regulator
MIEKFMTAKLGLSGNELVLFSILWKESDKGQKIVEGDYKKLSEGMNVTIPTMYNSIKKLQERGYVEQVEKGLYQVNVKVA